LLCENARRLVRNGKGFGEVSNVLKMMALGLVVLCGQALASSVVQPDYRVSPKVFTGDDGLPPSGVSALVQDHDRYLWVGTFGGLARFDGLAFSVFRGRHAPGPVDTGPASDRIAALHVDDRGRLWIGTQDAGLSMLEQGQFRHLSFCEGSCQVSSILQAPDRGIWVASSEGVFKLDPDSGQEVWSGGARRAGYSTLAMDDRGRIYVGGHRSFHVVEGEGLRPIPLPDGSAAVGVLEGDDGHLMVGTERALYRFDTASEQWQAMGVDRPNAAVRDAEGLWWVSHGPGRVVREDGAGGWTPVSELSDMGVSRLAWDNEGNLWAGSASKGLLRTRKPLFRLLSEPQLGTSRGGRAVIGDGQGGFWFGASCGGLRHWSHDGRMRVVSRLKEAVGECIASLLIDRDGVLWIGTGEGGLARMAGGDPEHVASWATGETVNLWQRQDGRFLVSVGRSTYVHEFDGEGRISSRHRIEALQGMRITHVVESVNGGIWFVGDQGVLRLVGDEVVERWSTQDGLSSRFARALFEDEEAGILWVGTYGGGLNRIQDGRVRRYDSSNGLFDDTVSCILADDQGRLWLGGNRGVTLLPSPRAAAVDIVAVGLSASEGLVPAEINGGTSTPCHRDTRGRLWFSLVEGFGMIDPAVVPTVRSAVLEPRIEHVAAVGRALDRSGSTVTLQPFTRNLEIRYTAVNLSRPQETRFRFRLSGVDSHWVEAGQNRSVLYPSVPWGRHLFEVQARIAGGEWSPVPASLQIIHPQPWYQRPWIWMTATLLGLLVLVGSTLQASAETVSGGPGVRRH